MFNFREFEFRKALALVSKGPVRTSGSKIKLGSLIKSGVNLQEF